MPVHFISSDILDFFSHYIKMRGLRIPAQNSGWWCSVLELSPTASVSAARCFVMPLQVDRNLKGHEHDVIYLTHNFIITVKWWVGFFFPGWLNIDMELILFLWWANHILHDSQFNRCFNGSGNEGQMTCFCFSAAVRLISSGSSQSDLSLNVPGSCLNHELVQCPRAA